MNRIRVIFDTVQFEMKPTRVETATMVGHRMEINDAHEYSIDEIKLKLTSGYTIRPSVCGGGEDTWREQQLFMIDVDGGISISDAINAYISQGLTPSFVYTTYSSTEDNLRFRLAFVTDESITEKALADSIQHRLMSILPQCDLSCQRLYRIYYGGSEVVYESDSTINHGAFALLYTPKVENTKEYSSVKAYDIKHEFPTKDIIRYIKKHDSQTLNTILRHPVIEFDTIADFFEYIQRINICQVFNLNSNTKCILHNDSEASASIYQSNIGRFYYCCHSSNCDYAEKSLSFESLIQILGEFETEYNTLDFIKEILNLRVRDSPWQRTKRKNLHEIRDAIESGRFNSICPQASKNLKTCFKYFLEILDVADEHLFTDKYTDKSGNPAFFISSEFLLLRMKLNKRRKSEVNNKIKAFAYHGMLNILDDDVIPKELLEKSIQYSREKKFRISWYSIPEFDDDHIKHIEDKGVEWLTNGYTFRAISRELFYRTEGKNVANALYPQNKDYISKNGNRYDRTTTKESDELTTMATRYIIDEIKIQGFCTEKKAMYLIKDINDLSENKSMTQIKRSLTQILRKNDLVKVTLNNALKDRFGIKHSKSYPKVVIMAVNAEKQVA